MEITTKVTINIEDMDTVEMVELFHSLGSELGYRGQWSVLETRERFACSLTRQTLALWAATMLAEASKHGVAPPPVKASCTAPIVTRLSEAEQALAETGRKIPAIKAYRERTMIGLKEAKEEVDAWAANALTRRAEQLALALIGPTPAPVIY